MKGKTIIPAMIAETQGQLDDRIRIVKDHAEIIQLDFMDGLFVPNKSISFDFNLPEKDIFYEAHLMLDDPLAWIKAHASKVGLVLAPIETSVNLGEIIDEIRSKGAKTGFVLNPETPISRITEFISQLDQVLIMTVNPGAYGAPFLPETLSKVSELRALAPLLDIEVDGGITDKTIGPACEAGANLFVSGSYIVKSDSPGEAMRTLKSVVGD